MMNPHVDDHDQMMLISQYYPDGIITQLVEEAQGGAAEKVKGRRRRRKNKGEEGGGDMIRKRKLSEEQVNMLEKSFGSEHKLESERKELLAAELQMDPRQVAVWFQNRRARWKTKKLEEEYSKLRSQHESTIVEKCHLESELINIKEQLNEAEKEIQRLLERGDGFTSNSPSSSLSMDTNMDPPFLGELGMDGLPNVFYMPEDNYAHCLGWDDNIYSYM